MSLWLPADWDAPAGIVAGTTLRDAGLEAIDLPGRPCQLNQVHGAVVVNAGPYDDPPAADASVSRTPAWACVVRTADCLPVLFAAGDGSVVAAAHAGWRGLAAGVLEATVAAMDCSPATLVAWIGPAISQTAFEVGPEVRAAFLASNAAADRYFAPNARGRWQADLYGLARQRLGDAGVHRVSGGGWCTHGDPGRFYSYRRDGSTGRHYSFVALPPGA